MSDGRTPSRVSDTFSRVFSFFVSGTNKGPGEPRNASNVANQTVEVTLTRLGFLPRPYTHYNYCHLVVCCSGERCVKKELVSLSGVSV